MGEIKKMKMVTMQNISDACGFSITTVSNVLNNNGKFSSKTRDKVMMTAKRLGYLIDYSLYEDKLIAIKISEGIKEHEREALISLLSSIAFSMGLTLQLARPDEVYPALLAIGKLTDKQEKDLKKHTASFIHVDDNKSLELGPVRTARLVVETLSTLQVFDPVVLYDRKSILDQFEGLERYESLDIESLDEKRIENELSKFEHRTFILLCPHDKEMLFRVLKRLDNRGLLLLVNYTGHEMFDDSNMRYLRFDVYEVAAIAQLLAMLSDKKGSGDDLVLKTSISLMGGI